MQASSKAAVPSLFGTSFVEDNCSMDQGGGDGFKMIQARYISRALYLSHYYISSTSEHQSLAPRAWESLV